MPVTGHKKGLWAETLACGYLLLKGYRIVARRFKTPLGEIDIVARRGKTVVFVEVKLRGTERTAAEAVHPRNQERVRQAAALYLQRHPGYTNMAIRFDAIVMTWGSWPRHITDAF